MENECAHGLSERSNFMVQVSLFRDPPGISKIGSGLRITWEGLPKE